MVLDSLAESECFAKISNLLSVFPWNNFLQLKVISIYEEILEHSENVAFRQAVIEKSNIAQTLCTLAKQASFQHESERNIRHGYMAAVIKLGNCLHKHCEKDEVKAYLASVGEEWISFVVGELKKSNELNNKNLGGQQPR